MSKIDESYIGKIIRVTNVSSSSVQATAGNAILSGRLDIIFWSKGKTFPAGFSIAGVLVDAHLDTTFETFDTTTKGTLNG